MTTEECGWFNRGEAIAKDKFDGHLTVMRFTTNWRVMFGTPDGRDGIGKAFEGKTLSEALTNAIEANQ